MLKPVVGGGIGFVSGAKSDIDPEAVAADYHDPLCGRCCSGTDD